MCLIEVNDVVDTIRLLQITQLLNKISNLLPTKLNLFSKQVKYFFQINAANSAYHASSVLNRAVGIARGK